MKSARWPALVLIPALLLAMLVLARVDEDEPSAPGAATAVAAEPGRAPDLMPIAEPVGAASDTWYCAGLTASGGFGAREGSESEGSDSTLVAETPERDPVIDESALIVANIGEGPRQVQVRLFGPDGALENETIEVGGHSRARVDLAEIGEGAEVAALVEVDGGGVSVVQEAAGPAGRTVSPCVTDPAGSWYIPAASTTLDARAVLSLFNPFPDDAIVEVSFFDGEQVRIPTGFEAFPVPAKSVVTVDLTDLITVRPQFATAIVANTGQVAVAMVQSYDGSEGPEGVAIVPGAPTPADTWVFPTGRWSEDQRETYIVYNPGERDAQVDLTVALDDPATNGSVQAFELTVPRGEYVVLGSSADEWARVPAGVAHSATVRSRNGEPVVAAQRLSDVGDDAPGMAMAMGSPQVASRWIVTAVDLEASSGSVTVLNGSPLSLARVEVSAAAGGTEEALPSFEIEQGLRAAVRPNDEVDLVASSAVIDASSPVVVSSSFSFGGSDGRAWLVAVPVAGTETAPGE